MGILRGEAGGTRETEPGGPRGAVFWSLHIDKNSKNPSKQSLVREIEQTISFLTTLLFVFDFDLLTLARSDRRVDGRDRIENTCVHKGCKQFARLPG